MMNLKSRLARLFRNWAQQLDPEFKIPPVQLSDEQIRKYNQELMRQYAALIPALRPPISILYIK